MQRLNALARKAETAQLVLGPPYQAYFPGLEILAS
jgi:hypothetical protein